MKKIALILCLVLVASFVLSGCNNSDSIITLEDREVGKIEIQSGNTGETVEVTEEEVISQIADILSLEFEKGEKSNDSTGWSYSVRWYDTEGKQIDTVVSSCTRRSRVTTEVLGDSCEAASFSPRQGAKALSYCQPRRGGGVKVLLRYFLTRK